MPKNTWGIYYLYYLLKKTTATFRCSKQLPDGRSWPFRPVARQCAGQWLKCAFAALRNLCIYLGVKFSGNLAELLDICVLLVSYLMLYVHIFLKNDDTHELFILWGYHLWDGFFQDIYMSTEATLGAWVQWAVSHQFEHPGIRVASRGWTTPFAVHREISAKLGCIRKLNKWPIATKNPPKFPESEVRF